MWKHLLIPLDGSRLAEAALPAATYLAQKLAAGVTLIHIIERDVPRAVHGERHLTDAGEARAYLDEVARQAFPAHLRVERHVHTDAVGNVARSLVEHAEELKLDLIVMCTHGRGGVRDLMFGSIAQQVVARRITPVLLMRPTGGGPQPFLCRRVLAPLDGTPAHERGLAVAADLVHACMAELYLVVVVPTPETLPGEQAAAGLLLPRATTEVLQLVEQDAREYLGRQMAQLQAQGLSVAAEVGRGDPATVIIETARQAGADLIIMGTHGRTALDAFWAGSIAPRVSSRSKLPLLLVPIHAPEELG